MLILGIVGDYAVTVAVICNNNVLQSGHKNDIILTILLSHKAITSQPVYKMFIFLILLFQTVTIPFSEKIVDGGHNETDKHFHNEDIHVGCYIH